MVQAVMRAMGRDGDRWGAGESLLAGTPLTSCCAAWFLTGCRPFLVRSPGVGDPCSRLLGNQPRYQSQTDVDLNPRSPLFFFFNICIFLDLFCLPQVLVAAHGIFLAACGIF